MNTVPDQPLLSPIRRFFAARFSATGEFGLYLTAGVLLMVFSVWIFGEIAEKIAPGSQLSMLDLQLSQYLHGYAASVWTGPLKMVTHAHSPGVVLLVTALLGWRLYRRGERYWLYAMLSTVTGGVILNVLLKYIYQRARPSFTDPVLGALTEYSFPSGHTMGATLLYGYIAAYVVSHVHSRAGRAATVLGAVVMVLLVAFSRVFLGAHYPSDVLAAMAEGVAWLSVCITACSTLRRRREARLLT